MLEVHLILPKVFHSGDCLITALLISLRVAVSPAADSSAPAAVLTCAVLTWPLAAVVTPVRRSLGQVLRGNAGSAMGTKSPTCIGVTRVRHFRRCARDSRHSSTQRRQNSSAIFCAMRQKNYGDRCHRRPGQRAPGAIPPSQNQLRSGAALTRTCCMYRRTHALTGGYTVNPAPVGAVAKVSFPI